LSGTVLPNVIVLISGEGTNLQALIDSAESGALPARIAAVFSDRRDARGLERARKAGIPARHVGRDAFPDGGAYERALAGAIDDAVDGPSKGGADAPNPAAVVLAGFMRILRGELLRRFAGRIVNIHPSLLPKYRGLDTHARVLAAGDAKHGATVHFVTDELDAGPLIIQYRMPVRADDTPESLAARVHRGEHRILPQAVAWLAAGRLRLDGENVILDGDRLAGPVVVEDQND
jgi:phosphoribosylglycinamide formyltransferase 1